MTDNIALDGGGILNDLGTLTVSNSTISNNSADDGGGISNFGGTLKVERSTISGNTAGAGGGICSDTRSDFSTSKTTITNSTISGNRSSPEVSVISSKSKLLSSLREDHLLPRSLFRVPLL